MLRMLRSKLRRLYSRLWWLIWKHPKRRVIIKRFGKMNVKGRQKGNKNKARVYTKSQVPGSVIERPFRVATFNVAMFSLAPAVPIAEKPTSFGFGRSPVSHCPKSILKQSPLHTALSKPKVSINLPDNEISLANNKLPGLSKTTDERYFKSQVPVRSPVCFPFSISNWHCEDHLASGRTILEVLKEAGADILALQDVKAEESKGMKPLSDLAAALGMHYVFAESWAPEYGNAVLSKWPIKRWNVQKIADDDDFRNLLKVAIDVPGTGEVNIYCTQLDHLDENWRMRQINAIAKSVDSPHILVGGLNSLERSDYSPERWTDIVEYYEKVGKPTPKVEVMKFLKGKGYIDSKDYAGDCVPVVIMAKGQNVQGTCKYGTRVDYILASQDSTFRFVPGSYSVISSKGTSDHHIVKAEFVGIGQKGSRGRKDLKQRIARLTQTCSSIGMSLMHT
ncbi:uncharacterized protein LOC111791386 [Cucurbita pepo subsp. pepo]|uniref:uncharacterized protein LOC111791386 n=1 Tax=Cucurbita pepo subsp. pepo TaxID=3664 RepID=UPI000C9D97F3|nr:uncharacterized protein LOC111791386 [Cucurbita pepo subsp. pepo]XP_023528469.1 uncharacterized protein LOC111791386 [Cucurbita pepo subsp. pepo]XP_023528470.1 uncharacterized protein LOC111791386 [Cucurbita pepo subsp. pepo]XP_023528471.1 uncharacterized protein LOC111791386 [Cucurbita pepo subsp. pepo]XP_023528473.1 uncharacterized protein LOC111791386 [Cucurbita pepo subsp. pepo]XP_023528474.1 uncharacterized protein LOC111791386 [Cucurbita pepo subsp. pepo]